MKHVMCITYYNDKTKTDDNILQHFAIPSLTQDVVLGVPDVGYCQQTDHIDAIVGQDTVLVELRRNHKFILSSILI